MSHPRCPSFAVFCMIARSLLFTLFLSVAFFDTFLLTMNPYRSFSRLLRMYFNKKKGVVTNLPLPNTALKSFSLTTLCVLISTAILLYREFCSPFSSSFCNGSLARCRTHALKKTVFSCPFFVFWRVCFSHIFASFICFLYTVCKELYEIFPLKVNPFTILHKE